MQRPFLKIASTAALAAGMLFAQAPAPPAGQQPGPAAAGRQQGAWRRRGRLFSSLNLTDDQKAQAKSIFQSARQTAQPVAQQLRQVREALRNAAKSGSPDAEIDKLANAEAPLVAQLAAVRAKAFAKFYALLTPEQRDKLQNMQANRMFGMRGGRRPGQALLQ